MFVQPWLAAVAFARASMSGSGSMPMTACARAATGMVSWPVPQPRSRTTPWLSGVNASASQSMTTGSYPRTVLRVEVHGFTAETGGHDLTLPPRTGQVC